MILVANQEQYTIMMVQLVKLIIAYLMGFYQVLRNLHQIVLQVVLVVLSPHRTVLPALQKSQKQLLN